jgi:hypothetical protein
VHIFQHQQHGLFLCERNEQGHERLQGALPLLLWAQLQRRIALWGEGQVEQCSNDGRVLQVETVLLPEALELLDVLGRGGVMINVHETLHQIDNWMQGGVLIVRRTPTLQA